MLRSYIQALIEGSTEVSPEKALGLFKKLAGKKKHQEAIRFAQANLPLLGTGSSRAVIKDGDDRVIKFAINKAGMAQNSVEANPALQSKYGDIVAKVYGRSPDNFWIEMDLAIPVEDRNEADLWAERLGAGSYGMLARYVFEVFRLHKDSTDDFAEEEEALDHKYPAFEEIAKSPRVRQIIELMIEHGLTPGDLVPIGSMAKCDGLGFTAEGRPIVVDYGLSFDVWEEYYQMKPGDVQDPQGGAYRELEKFSA